MSFQPLGLMPELLGAVSAQGYTQPTAVQTEAIPFVLAGRDVLASAQTGTGKTAAFVLPILQRLTLGSTAGAPAGSSPRPAAHAQRRHVRCLVLTPTRELAIQVGESVAAYGRGLDIHHATIFGGVGFEPQVRQLRRGVDVVVATPGRLLDHANQRTIDLRGVEILVLDEADRMLDMGFIRDIRRVLELLPAHRQNLLFSATFSDEIRTLAGSILRDPAAVQATPPNSTVAAVRHVVLPVERTGKRGVLSHLIRSGTIETALVFTRTKHGADRLAEQLGRDGIATAAIHGNKGQSQRIRALTDFKDGRVAILVATDIAARGLDIDALPHVVNYDLPSVPSDYVHRIGRTGRAGMDGDAVSLVSPEEAPLLREIERLLGRTIPREAPPAASGARPAHLPAAVVSVPSAPRGAGRPPRRRPVSGQRPEPAHTVHAAHAANPVHPHEARTALPGERFRRAPGSERRVPQSAAPRHWRSR